VQAVKVIVAGSRGVTDYLQVVEAMSNAALFGIVPTCVFSGTARGVDRLGERWASERGVLIRYFPADWDTLGKRAGYVRNAQMADNADALVALWDGDSRGTKHMIDLASAKGLEVMVFRAG